MVLLQGGSTADFGNDEINLDMIGIFCFLFFFSFTVLIPVIMGFLLKDIQGKHVLFESCVIF